MGDAVLTTLEIFEDCLPSTTPSWRDGQALTTCNPLPQWPELAIQITHVDDRMARLPQARCAAALTVAVQSAMAGGGGAFSFQMNQNASAITNLDGHDLDDGMQPLVSADLISSDSANVLAATDARAKKL
ncbi:hypothetical protein [Roseomonas sp. WA12]